MVEKNIKKLSSTLDNLLKAKSIKYSEWNVQDDNIELKNQAGVYHFFQKTEENIYSLYVGKAGFGKEKKWSLFERLKQHFQESQKNTLLGKYASKNNLLPNAAKLKLEKSEVYLQWLPIFKKNGITESLFSEYSVDDLEKQILQIECFCIAILQPEYTAT